MCRCLVPSLLSKRAFAGLQAPDRSSGHKHASSRNPKQRHSGPLLPNTVARKQVVLAAKHVLNPHTSAALLSRLSRRSTSVPPSAPTRPPIRPRGCNRAWSCCNFDLATTQLFRPARFCATASRIDVLTLRSENCWPGLIVRNDRHGSTMLRGRTVDSHAPALQTSEICRLFAASTSFVERFCCRRDARGNDGISSVLMPRAGHIAMYTKLPYRYLRTSRQHLAFESKL
jgi:hypothetical protein